MRRWNQPVDVVLLCVAVVACGEASSSKGDDTSGGPSGTNGTQTTNVGSSASNTSDSTSESVAASTTSEATTSQAPLEPFVLENGGCKPLLQPEPEPVYVGDSVFAHIRSVSSWGEDVYFSEYADFDDIPPRIARLRPDNSVDTLVDGNTSNLKVIADTLYFVDDEGLKSLDLKTPGATPQALMAVTNVIDFDLSTVLYRDADYEVQILPFGAEVSDAGIAPIPLPEPSPGGVALFGDRIYFSDLETVFSVGVDGQGQTPLIATDSFNYILAVGTDGNTVLFDNQDVLYSVPSAGGAVTELGRAGEDGLFPNSTASFDQYFFGRDVVYWVDDGHGFGWTALDGQTCGLLGRFDSFDPPAGHLSPTEFIAGGDDGLVRVPRID